MNSNFVIPAIDIIDGKAVRLSEGDFTRSKVYYTSPLDVAQQFEDAGFSRVHIVDLDGAKAGRIINFQILESIATATSLVIDFGGGVNSIYDVQRILNAGAAMVTIGSLAAKQPSLIEEWLLEFGAGNFFIGADVLNGRIKINGWQSDAGLSVFDFIGNLLSIGAINIFCTDIAKDGMMKGVSSDLYKQIIERYPEINLVASGGVSCVEDIDDLKNIGCKAVIIGKAIYEGLIDWKTLAAVN